MAHVVYKRRGNSVYAELYENVPGKRGKKRFLSYLGKVSASHDARREQMLATADRKAEEIAAWQRSEFGESGEERAERVAGEVRFSQEAFLETTDPAPSEPSVPDPSPSDPTDTGSTSPDPAV